MDQLLFKMDINGVSIPLKPWPQKFYISKTMLMESFEIRPLTFTGLIKGVTMNFITMSYWRFTYLLFKIGFFDTAEGCRLSWKDWRFDFWRVRDERRRGVVSVSSKGTVDVGTTIIGRNEMKETESDAKRKV